MGSRKVSLADKMKKVNAMQTQGVKKGQGVDAFFTSTIDGESIEKPDNCTNVNTFTDTSTGTFTVTSPSTDTALNTNPVSGTDSVLDSLLSSNEQFVRCVAYLRKDQAAFVKDLSKQLTKKNKGKRIKESEIFRMAMDMLMKVVNK
ncbi:hypothetical protein K2F40_14870 [Clostridium sp. CM028]|uniref:hypothetical protein n=1 Tax=unclassified Clostridium TaxID=2614128 RepID=UPI001C6F1476|nr:MULTISPECIES: hypothetical protein [unclassified Clostridium]MBW9146865.1 hypothetical protein [Clostridium sp. CM027]MBW9150241.1 hypothetical protein [Clostridium sp. CM028]UVE42844.1 hypothetical protein KTC92_18155 [Clostridium sp. CM027]WLC63465.1 hypothetical protein KTC94_17205 [Clostridium sp. CM028]